MELSRTSAAQGQRSVAGPSPARPPAWRGTLLIVDDDESPRRSLEMIFREHYQVLLAPDGPTALELVRRHPVDVAVVDIRMPGMSGLELLARLKALDAGLEVVLVTAFQTLDTARQALRLGARDYLGKPFGLEEIRAVVAAAMEHRSLGDRLQDNAQQLDALQREIEAQQQQLVSTRARNELYAGIVHDINSPLTVISGLIELLNERCAQVGQISGDELATLRQELGQIAKQVGRCINISRRYLSLMRQPASGGCRAPVQRVLVDLGELLAAHPLRSRHEVVVRPPGEDVDVELHEVDLLQILLNLALNALTCSPRPHRVVLAAQPAAGLPAPAAPGAGRVLIVGDRFDRSVPLWMLTVEDDGVGIPPEMLPRIFEPYFSARQAGEGTGLGLTIVRRLVGQSRGLLEVASRPGEGTRFSLYLPRAGAGVGAGVA